MRGIKKSRQFGRQLLQEIQILQPLPSLLLIVANLHEGLHMSISDIEELLERDLTTGSSISDVVSFPPDAIEHLNNQNKGIGLW